MSWRWSGLALAAIAMSLGGCQSGGGPAKAEGTASAVDATQLKSSDNQPLVLMDEGKFAPPPRPGDPLKLPETDPLHWYDMEYSGWNAKKEKMPASPGDGPKGKHVICLRFTDHAYLTAFTNGMNKVAQAYGMTVDHKTAGGDAALQAQQVDQAINEKPDLVVILAVNASAVVAPLRKLHAAGIPVIASNIIPADEGMKYVLAWTGPNDWGQFRMLAREFAKKLNYQGDYCIVRHFPGGSPYFSRTYAPLTELQKIAPKMRCLDMQPTKLEAEKTMQVVSDWLTRYGTRLKGIISADDSDAMNGISQALKRAGRTDVVVVAAGNSKVGMDFVKSGELFAITYQSAEADGALPMVLAAQWFSGKPLDKPVYYLPQKVITKANVDQFMPAQW